MSHPILYNFINGEFVASDANETWLSKNPAQPAEVIAEAPASTKREISAAIESANSAKSAWASLAAPARADHLHRWAAAIEARAEEIAVAVAKEVGKPISEAKGEVGRCAVILRYFAGEAVHPTGEVIPGLVSSHLQYSVRVPLGVVALITPWNFPLAIPLWKAAPALAFGNTVVMKPSEHSPLAGYLLAETAKQAGLPTGVFNVVFADGRLFGDLVVASGSVQGVSFTGSATVGTSLAEKCACANLKFQGEMGGKNAGIVLADADLAKAANLVAGGAMRFAGQKCTATSRAIVIESVMDAFLAELETAIRTLPVGSPQEVSTAIGPVISEVSQMKLQSMLAVAQVKSLADFGPVPSEGYYVSPTVVKDVAPQAPLAQEELFGPVLSVIRARDLDHALEIANGVPYGLSASLFTRDVASVLNYVNRIEAGMVRVNADTTGVDPHAPFGGVKGSSTHSREQGPAAKDFFTEMKTVQIAG